MTEEVSKYPRRIGKLLQNVGQLLEKDFINGIMHVSILYIYQTGMAELVVIIGRYTV